MWRLWAALRCRRIPTAARRSSPTARSSTTGRATRCSSRGCDTPHPAFGHLLPREKALKLSALSLGRGCREAAGEGMRSHPSQHDDRLVVSSLRAALELRHGVHDASRLVHFAEELAQAVV